MSDKLTFVTWLWKPTGWRNDYSYFHVNRLKAMLNKHVKMKHELICFTDHHEDALRMTCDRIIPIWDETVDNSFTRDQPCCWRRLKMFSEDVRDLVGDRFISIDLDVVILNDITDLFTRREDFVILRGNVSKYNGSLWMMDTGSRSKVWTEFDPETSPHYAKTSLNANGGRVIGSDQAWMSYILDEGEKTWGEEDGIYQYMNLKPWERLPKNAKIVFFAGEIKPWSNHIFNTLSRIYTSQ